MKHLYTLLLASGLLATGAQAQMGATLPEKNQMILSPSFVFQTADQFYLGGLRGDLPADLEQWSTFLSFEYGITSNLAFDVTLGWSEGRFMGNTSEGLTDTQLGLRYGLLTGENGTTLTLRAGAIIAGGYAEGFIFSPGDGASGFQIEMLGLQDLGAGFGLYGNAGYRTRDNDVPDDVFGSAGIYYVNGAVSASLGWSATYGQSGGDIGGPGFGTTFGFPQVREEQQAINASVGYTAGNGITYAVFGSTTIEGRNTPNREVIGFSINIPFGGSPSDSASCSSPASYK